MTDKQKDILKKIIIGALLIVFAIALDYCVFMCKSNYGTYWNGF